MRFITIGRGDRKTPDGFLESLAEDSY